MAVEGFIRALHRRIPVPSCGTHAVRVATRKATNGTQRPCPAVFSVRAGRSYRLESSACASLSESCYNNTTKVALFVRVSKLPDKFYRQFIDITSRRSGKPRRNCVGNHPYTELRSRHRRSRSGRMSQGRPPMRLTPFRRQSANRACRSIPSRANSRDRPACRSGFGLRRVAPRSAGKSSRRVFR